MAGKTCSEEFRRVAVELYRVTEGVTISKIAGDLGITDATLSAEVKAGRWRQDAGQARRTGGAGRCWR